MAIYGEFAGAALSCYQNSEVGTEYSQNGSAEGEFEIVFENKNIPV
jgi:hypothetical protein